MLLNVFQSFKITATPTFHVHSKICGYDPKRLNDIYTNKTVYKSKQGLKSYPIVRLNE